ncbi:tRNA (adenosine(37)-N6)-threonylcarbamoyltransferase complex ATPase subunit type 1 TsaE [Patescibacteria group bacterium]|nr:tRNA (adenosine(37)-N6)-threonylcarbamoyltransferase complex ATPase subunit type 1 TsaE [Patescibacteria group bacterium]
MKKYISLSEDETKKIAESIAKNTKSNIFALTGKLGAGKTIFVQGFAKGLGITEKITSPTFVLIHQHKIPKSSKILYHIDLYRLENLQDINNLGLEEIISNPNNIVLIEWAKKLKKLPKTTVRITFEKTKENTRAITFL